MRVRQGMPDAPRHQGHRAGEKDGLERLHARAPLTLSIGRSTAAHASSYRRWRSTAPEKRSRIVGKAAGENQSNFGGNKMEIPSAKCKERLGVLSPFCLLHFSLCLLHC